MCACKRHVKNKGCSSITIPTGMNYTQVCGKVRGYQVNSPDAFRTKSNGINRGYVDGVSITHGNPRQHIFTFACGNDASLTNQCPCNRGSKVKGSVPGFVGEDYYCESGSMSGFRGGVYKDDVLWDGKMCNKREGPCCTSPNFPYFEKDLGSPTSDDIELRVCRNQNESDEDILLKSYVIYIR